MHKNSELHRCYNFCFKWKTPVKQSAASFFWEQKDLIDSTKAFDRRFRFSNNPADDENDVWLISFKSRRSIKKIQETFKKYCVEVYPDLIDLRFKHGGYCRSMTTNLPFDFFTYFFMKQIDYTMKTNFEYFNSTLLENKEVKEENFEL